MSFTQAPEGTPLSILLYEDDVASPPAGAAEVPARGRGNKIGLALVLAAVVLPFLICVLYVQAFGVNVPYQDDWDFIVQILVKGDYGQVTPWKFFQVQQAEHKLFVPYLIMLVSGKLTSFNMMANMYLNLALLASTIGLLLSLAWTCVKGSRCALLALVPVAWIMCSLRQWENLLFGIQLCIYTVCLFQVLSVFLLNRARKVDGSFWLAAVSAVLASYSNGNGILIWPIGILQLFLRNRAETLPNKRFKSACILWTCLTALFVIFYCANFRWHPAHLSSFPGNFRFRFLREDPLGCAEFLLLLLGNPFVADTSGALAGGAVFLVLCAMAFYPLFRRKFVADKALIPVYMLMLIGLLFYAAAFWGRVGLAVDTGLGSYYHCATGMQTALASRYSTVGNIAVVGLYLLFFVSPGLSQLQRGIRLGAVLAMVAIMTIASFGEAPAMGENWYNSRRVEAELLRGYALQGDRALARVHPYKNWCSRSLSYANQHRLSVFATQKPDAGKLVGDRAGIDCTILAINEKSPFPAPLKVVRSENDLAVRGWAHYPGRAKAYADVAVVLDGAFVMPTAYGLYRTDLIRPQAKLKEGKTGFEAHCRPNLLSTGLHTISLRAFSPDGKHFTDSDALTTIELQ